MRAYISACHIFIQLARSVAAMQATYIDLELVRDCIFYSYVGWKKDNLHLDLRIRLQLASDKK